MLTILDKSNNLYKIHDDFDNSIDYCDEKTLNNLKNIGIKLNFNKKSKITIDNHIIDSLLSKIRKLHSYDYEDKEIYPDYANVSFRWWGEWHVPNICDTDFESEEEYEFAMEDYDWEELDYSWGKKMSELINKFNETYKDLYFSWQTGEKNYIYINVKVR